MSIQDDALVQVKDLDGLSCRAASGPRAESPAPEDVLIQADAMVQENDSNGLQYSELLCMLRTQQLKHEEHVAMLLSRHAKTHNEHLSECLRKQQTSVVDAVREAMLQNFWWLQSWVSQGSHYSTAKVAPGAGDAPGGTEGLAAAGFMDSKDPAKTKSCIKTNGVQAPLRTTAAFDDDLLMIAGESSRELLDLRSRSSHDDHSPRVSGNSAPTVAFDLPSKDRDPHSKDRGSHDPEDSVPSVMFHIPVRGHTGSRYSEMSDVGEFARGAYSTCTHVPVGAQKTLGGKSRVVRCPKKIDPRRRSSAFGRIYSMRGSLSAGLTPKLAVQRVWAVLSNLQARHIVQSRAFELSVAGLIMLNAVVIGVQTDWAVRNIGDDPPFTHRVLDLFFAAGFTLELMIRLIAEKRSFLASANPNLRWNIFDSLLVFSAFVEEMFSLVGTESLDMSAMRVLRIMRLVRVLRIVRVLRMFSDLRKMVMGIASSLKSLMWCLLLLFMIMFTFGVCLMQIATEELVTIKRNPDVPTAVDSEAVISYFGSLITTIYTLYRAICGGIDWSDATEPLMAIHPALVAVFAVYIAFAVFCVLNIVTGVFVENSTKITQQCDDSTIFDELAMRVLWEEVQEIFSEADKNASGELDWYEFEACLKDKKVKEYFQKLHISLEPECVHAMFQLLDFSGDGSVDMDEFVNGCSHIHGTARSFDILRLSHENKRLSEQIDELGQNLTALVEETQERLVSISMKTPRDRVGSDHDPRRTVVPGNKQTGPKASVYQGRGPAMPASPRAMPQHDRSTLATAVSNHPWMQPTAPEHLAVPVPRPPSAAYPEERVSNSYQDLAIPPICLPMTPDHGFGMRLVNVPDEGSDDESV